jgi:hypothetical protein
MSLETRKMPDPMVSPITIAVADQRPRPRTKLVSSEVCPADGRLIVGFREPTLRIGHRQSWMKLLVETTIARKIMMNG